MLTGPEELYGSGSLVARVVDALSNPRPSRPLPPPAPPSRQVLRAERRRASKQLRSNGKRLLARVQREEREADRKEGR